MILGDLLHWEVVALPLLVERGVVYWFIQHFFTHPVAPGKDTDPSRPWAAPPVRAAHSAQPSQG